MAKNKIPTAAEVRAWIEKEKAETDRRWENGLPIEGHGPTFQGENIWAKKITLPLLEAAESSGFSDEGIWPLCRKLAAVTHMPLNKKESDRMIPFSEIPGIVDTVLKMLETYIPPFEEEHMFLSFDTDGYFYSLALILLSDYRIDDCEKQLWTTANQFIADEYAHHRCWMLVRSLSMVKEKHPYVLPMIAKLEDTMTKYPKRE